MTALMLPYALAFGLVMSRIGALVMTAPIFSSMVLNTHVKIALIGTLSMAVLFAAPYQLAQLPVGAFQIAGAVILELAVGGIMGFAVSIMFAALDLAGQLIGIQMGFAMANVVDPTTMQQVGVLAQVLRMTAMMLFLASNGHLMMIQALFETFHHVPLGGASLQGGPIVTEVIRLGGELFAAGLQIALPVCCVVLLVNVGLAAVARAVPQVSIFSIGFLLTIGAGITVLGLALPGIATTFNGLILEAVREAFRLARMV